jgi:hypothetical protein
MYVFDNNSLSTILKFYYRGSFRSFWANFDNIVATGNVISVRMVRLEMERKFDNSVLDLLITHNADFFENPTQDELNFIPEIYAIPHFQQNLDQKTLLSGVPHADPFIIAKARVRKATVVSEEKNRENAAKIPNICEEFNIPCIDLQGFLMQENWTF